MDRTVRWEYQGRTAWLMGRFAAGWAAGRSNPVGCVFRLAGTTWAATVNISHELASVKKSASIFPDKHVMWLPEVTPATRGDV
jgi:hypothetical protein